MARIAVKCVIVAAVLLLVTKIIFAVNFATSFSTAFTMREAATVGVIGGDDALFVPFLGNVFLFMFTPRAGFALVVEILIYVAIIANCIIFLQKKKGNS